jgi:glycosyltransferase involved in cell wall biosynthesis
MKKYTVTIGIPAFNEGRNIKRLLQSLLVQKTKHISIEKIIVFSDGCTDNTVSEAASLNYQRIDIRSISKRKGKANALNRIDQIANTDIMVQVDADTLIRDSWLIEKLVLPIRSSGADLTSARVKEYWTTNKFEDVLKISMLMKKEIFESYKKGNNIYTCHGRARALTKRLYKSIVFNPDIVAEDAYVYLFAVKNKFNYAFASKANIHYHLPGTLADHQKQSVRFFKSYQQLRQEFGELFIHRHTRLPKRFVIPVVIKYLLRYPVTMVIYLSILIAMKVRSLFVENISSTWTVAKSSKGAFGK